MIETVLQIDTLTWTAFVAASVVLMVTPGPGMMFCLACGLAGGPRAGVAAGLGSAAGMIVHTGLVAAGLSALLLAMPGAYDAVRFAGAAYLAWLAYASWRAGDELAERLGRRRMAHAFGRALVTNLMNPKVILFMVAFLPQFADPAAGTGLASVAGLRPCRVADRPCFRLRLWRPCRRSRRSPPPRIEASQPPLRACFRRARGPSRARLRMRAHVRHSRIRPRPRLPMRQS